MAAPTDKPGLLHEKASYGHLIAAWPGETPPAHSQQLPRVILPNRETRNGPPAGGVTINCCFMSCRGQVCGQVNTLGFRNSFTGHGYTSPRSARDITSAYRQQVQRLPRRTGVGARDVATQFHQVEADTGSIRNTSLSRISLLGSREGGRGVRSVCLVYLLVSRFHLFVILSID